MPMSIYLADAVLNHGFRDASWTKVANLYWALGSADFTAAGLTASELASAGGYARAAVAVDDAEWDAPATSGSYRVIINSNAIDFGTASANLNGSNPIGFISIWDASGIGAGNMWYYGVISTPQIVLSGQPIVIPVGGMQIEQGI
jgi:hypothetical protein